MGKEAHRKGLPGRLTKGAGTHLASWLQEVTVLSKESAQSLLDGTDENSSMSNNNMRKERAIAGLKAAHGENAGHANPITDMAYSGDIIITKDRAGMRLWRSRGDYALLRVVTCKGKHAAFHSNGQFIVTGTRGGGTTGGLKIWGPAGGSAYSVGK